MTTIKEGDLSDAYIRTMSEDEGNRLANNFDEPPGDLNPVLALAGLAALMFKNVELNWQMVLHLARMTDESKARAAEKIRGGQ